jgi:hypothetical protein
MFSRPVSNIHFNIIVTPKSKESHERNVEVRSYFMTDGQSVSMCWCRAHSGTCDQILLPVGMLISESCGLVSMGRPVFDDRTGLQFAVQSLSGPSRAEPVTVLYCLI